MISIRRTYCIFSKWNSLVLILCLDMSTDLQSQGYPFTGILIKLSVRVLENNLQRAKDMLTKLKIAQVKEAYKNFTMWTINKFRLLENILNLSHIANVA